MARDGRWFRRRRVVGIAGGVFAVAVLAVAPALACTPTANVELNPRSGEPGSAITVSGSVFDPGGAPVEIRWGGTSGDIVGRTGVNEAGQFSLTVILPRAEPGHYIVSAIQRLNDGGYKRSAASFEVTGKPPASQASAPPSGDQADAESKDQQPAPADVAVPANSSPAPAAGSAQPAPAPVPAPQAAPRVSPASSTVRGARAEVPAGGSSPETPTAAAPAPEADAGIATEPPESSVPPMAAVGDLWSGFGPDGSPGLESGRADRPGATADGDFGTLLVGAGLMALATVMMFVPAVPAISRRRRSLAEVANDEER